MWISSTIITKIEAFIASPEKLAKKIKNSYDNLKKQGKAKITVGVIDSTLMTLQEHWDKYEKTDIQITRQQPSLISLSKYYQSFIWIEKNNLDYYLIKNILKFLSLNFYKFDLILF